VQIDKPKMNRVLPFSLIFCKITLIVTAEIKANTETCHMTTISQVGIA